MMMEVAQLIRRWLVDLRAKRLIGASPRYAGVSVHLDGGECLLGFEDRVHHKFVDLSVDEQMALRLVRKHLLLVLGVDGLGFYLAVGAVGVVGVVGTVVGEVTRVVWILQINRVHVIIDQMLGVIVGLHVQGSVLRIERR